MDPKRCLVARSRRRAWWRSPSNDSTVSTTCSSTRGPASPPSLVTWPTSDDGQVALLGHPHQAVGALPDLGDRARGGGQVGVEDGLDGVDDHHRRGHLVEGGEDGRQLGLGQQPQPGMEGAQPLGPQPDLLGRLLGRHQQAPLRRRGHGGQGLQQEGGLADARLAADEGDRAGDQAAAEHPVELGDARGPGRPRGHVDLADRHGAGRGREPAADRARPRAAGARPVPPTSSWSVFHPPQPGHRPAHLAASAPHSKHR